MLINCPECNHNVSDRAVSCPQCGCPISTAAVVKTQATHSTPASRRKYKKLPNGMGCISKLSGKRRHPYAAYPPAKEFSLNGSAIRRKALGYYETYHEAYAALSAYMANPILPSQYTFSDVYEKMFQDKFSDPHSQIEFSDSCVKNYKWAYGKCEALYDRPMNTIFKEDMQNIIDNLNLGYSSSSNMMTLFRSIFRYALENGVVTTDYSDFVKIKQKREFEKGVPFTSEEIATIWANTKYYDATILLILIYSGLRISELKNCHIDLVENVFRGGLKTKAGKERIVPIHEKILPLVRDFNQEMFSVGNYQDRLIGKLLTTLGFPNAATGEKHTSQDCRHTFSWLADKYKMDEISKHLIMGHSLGRDVERNTYGHRTLDELRAEMAKIQE